MYQYDCQFCSEVFEDTADNIKEAGKAHVLDEHPDELEEAFRVQSAGDNCQGGNCSDWLPVEEDEHQGFNCRSCGHDHSNWFAGRHVYYHIEEVSA